MKVNSVTCVVLEGRQRQAESLGHEPCLSSVVDVAEQHKNATVAPEHPGCLLRWTNFPNLWT